MKYASVIQSVTLYLIIGLGSMNVAVAGSLAEAFKDFVLGAEAQAAVRGPQFTESSPSQQCISCHNGSRATAITLKSADTPLQYTGHVNSSHPVGMRYAEFAYREPASYVHPNRLDQRIQLENGEVTCISCHKTGSKQISMIAPKSPAEEANCNATGALTISPRQTDLCMSCHVM